MAEIRLTSRAEADLAGIADYTIETFGIEQARRYRDDLEGCFLTIAENPRLGRSAAALSAELRRIEHRSARRLLSRGRARCSDRSSPALQHGRRTSYSRAAAIHITPEQGAQHLRNGQDRGRSAPKRARMAIGARIGTEHSPAMASRSSSPVTTAAAWPARASCRNGRSAGSRHAGTSGGSDTMTVSHHGRYSASRSSRSSSVKPNLG